MNSREKILKATSHQKVDRCPTFIWINEDAMEKVRSYLGASSNREAKEMLGIDKWKDMHIDFSVPSRYKRQIDYFIPSQYKGDEDLYISEMGRVIRIHEDIDYLEDAIHYPLEDIQNKEGLEKYPLPRESWIEFPKDLDSHINKYKENDYIVSGVVSQPFKLAWRLRGMHNVFMDFLKNPALINEIYDHLYSFVAAKARYMVREGVDIIKIIGDLGMQDKLMISPSTWRKFDKPRLGNLISQLKSINPKLKVFMHTDGDVSEIISDIIEVGVDILNPIQPECMNPVDIKRQYGDKLVLHGGVSLQKTLPAGSPEDVEKEVRYLIKNCNINGGFIIGPSNVIFKEIPLENTVAMYNSVY